MAPKITVALEDSGTAGRRMNPCDSNGAGRSTRLIWQTARPGVPPQAPTLHQARSQGRPGPRRRPIRTTESRQRSESIRAWAKAQGIAVRDRGRISASVIQHYQAATTRG